MNVKDVAKTTNELFENLKKKYQCIELKAAISREALSEDHRQVWVDDILRNFFDIWILNLFPNSREKI